MPTSLKRFHNEALSSAEPARCTTAITKPKVNLLHILQQGWDLRSVHTAGFCSCWQPSPNSPPSLFIHPTTPLFASLSSRRRNMRLPEHGPKKQRRKSGPLFLPQHVVISPFHGYLIHNIEKTLRKRILGISLEFNLETLPVIGLLIVRVKLSFLCFNLEGLERQFVIRMQKYLDLV